MLPKQQKVKIVGKQRDKIRFRMIGYWVEDGDKYKVAQWITDKTGKQIHRQSGWEYLRGWQVDE